jgi:hypothetical protein
LIKGINYDYWYCWISRKRKGNKMIENIVVSGCSFTELNDEYISWSEIVANHFDIKNYVNLGMGAAGNYYISNSIVDYLECNQPAPEKTLVLVMWSGVSRKDIRISQEWWNLLDHQGYAFKAQTQYFSIDNGIDESNYFVFGGLAGGTLGNNDNIKSIFSWPDKVSSPEIVCKESLVQFLNLENYLKTHGYTYRFLSYLNYWEPNNIAKFGEYSIGLHCARTGIFKNFNFSNWVFVNNKKDCFGEYAMQQQQLDFTNHPTGQCHQTFAENIVIPNLKVHFK